MLLWANWSWASRDQPRILRPTIATTRTTTGIIANMKSESLTEAMKMKTSPPTKVTDWRTIWGTVVIRVSCNIPRSAEKRDSTSPVLRSVNQGMGRRTKRAKTSCRKSHRALSPALMNPRTRQ